MAFETTRFGRLEVSEEEAITFPSGIPGFPQAKRFVLLDAEEKSIFRFLQSLDDPDLTFVVADPLAFRPDYSAYIKPEEAVALQIERLQDAVVCVIMRMSDDPREVTVNLRAPLVINPAARLGRQIIQESPAYTVRHSLIDELERAKKLTVTREESALRTAGAG